ncbi:hypothetical protein PSM36_1464 [Proteiniphilum saccharofermentans]|uniref:Uncharacterized protein n=1 Tax=Proteiniphilum saccharofermentans TaxID=1642647 RepID=A0A1R3T8L5_9BACT|nr:hypothetical protein PSM36_1464 [Proteiniphilum saccharofermentans]
MDTFRYLSKNCNFALRNCFEFFHQLFFSNFLMDLDFHLLKCSGLLERNENSKAQKRAKNKMKE